MSEKHDYGNGSVVFEDFSIDVKNAIKEKALKFLKEAGEEITATTTRNTVRKTGKTAGSWESPVVDEAGLAVHMGSNYENAIWEEFGTGEFAEKGDGRKGWWVYIEGSKGSGSGGKSYSSLGEAKRAMAFLRKKGFNAHITKGKHARHPFKRAFNSCKNEIIKHAEQIFGELGS